MKEKKMMAIPC